jgi:hypothetical protein
MCFNNWRTINKIIRTPLEDNIMKKVLSLLAITLLVVGLTGCNDDPDGAKQRPGTSSSVAL